MENETSTQAVAPATAAAPAARPARPMMRKKKKVCIYCQDKIDHVDYKDVVRLRKHISESAKILPRRVSGACAKHQRQVTIAVKRARQVALLPYVTD